MPFLRHGLTIIQSFMMLLCVIFMIIPVGAINNNINCVQDNKVSIPGFKLNMVTGATSAKIRFLESFTGREF